MNPAAGGPSDPSGARLLCLQLCHLLLSEMRTQAREDPSFRSMLQERTVDPGLLLHLIGPVPASTIDGLTLEELHELREAASWRQRATWRSALPNHIDYRRCLPEIVRTIGSYAADRFAERSEGIRQLLVSDDAPLHAAVEQTAGWIEEARRLADIVEAAARTPVDAMPHSPPARPRLDEQALLKLEATTPALDRAGGSWVPAKLAAKLEELKTGTLGKYRRDGQQTSDRMFGCDKDGRIWRRAGTPRSHPHYLQATLVAYLNDQKSPDSANR